MTEVVKFASSTDDRDRMKSILDEAIARTMSGEVADLAVVLVARTDEGPEINLSWFGERQFAALLGGAVMLQDAMLHHDDEE